MFFENMSQTETCDMVYIVKKNIQLKADPLKVWDALTNPEKTKKYFFHCRVYSEWQQGSQILFKGRFFFFFPIELKGIILEIEPGKRLKYTLKNRKGENTSSSTVTIALGFANGETTLSISDDVGQGEGAEKRFKRSIKGWDKVLKGLKSVVERK